MRIRNNKYVRVNIELVFLHEVKFGGVFRPVHAEEFTRQFSQFDQQGKSLKMLRKNQKFLVKRWNDSV